MNERLKAMLPVAQISEPTRTLPAGYERRRAGPAEEGGGLADSYGRSTAVVRPCERPSDTSPPTVVVS